MKYIGIIFQRSGWKENGKNPSVPELLAVFEERNGPPNYGARQTPLTGEQCLALLQEETIPPQVFTQIERAFEGFKRMIVFSGDPPVYTEPRP